MDSVITMRNVSREFQVRKKASSWWQQIMQRSTTVSALTDVSLTIDQGERVVVVGKNGSGKSTLIKLLSGIIVPSQGQITVLGATPHRRSTAFLHRIGVMFGHKSFLFPDLSVDDALGLYAVMYQLSPDVFQQRLNVLDSYLDFKNLRPLPVRKLSLGQRMRCEVAAAFIHNPEVVFLDEPSIGMDAETTAALACYLKECVGTQQTVVLATHDPLLIRAFESRVLVFDHGHCSADITSRALDEALTFIKLIVTHTGVRNPLAYEQLQPQIIEQPDEHTLHVICRAAEKQALIDVINSSVCIESLTITSTKTETVLNMLQKREMQYG